MTDLSQSFNNLMNYMFENIGGHLVERLPGNKYKWREHIGTREEIKKAIAEAGNDLQNSLKNKST